MLRITRIWPTFLKNVFVVTHTLLSKRVVCIHIYQCINIGMHKVRIYKKRYLMNEFSLDNTDIF